jgi:hypothetical protein
MSPSIPSDLEETTIETAPTGPIPADGLAEAIPDWMTQPVPARAGRIDTSEAPKIDFGNLIESSDLPIWIRRITDPNAVDEEALPEPEPIPLSETEAPPPAEPTPWHHRIEPIGGATISTDSETAIDREGLSRSVVLAIVAVAVVAAVLAAIFLL